MVINNFNRCFGRSMSNDPIFELSRLWHPTCLDCEVSLQSMDASIICYTITRIPVYHVGSLARHLEFLSPHPAFPDRTDPPLFSIHGNPPSFRVGGPWALVQAVDKCMSAPAGPSARLLIPSSLATSRRLRSPYAPRPPAFCAHR
jgi:hypothetical protein